MQGFDEYFKKQDIKSFGKGGVICFAIGFSFSLEVIEVKAARSEEK